MMEKQRFSFIIPVLNGEKYIRQCLESILLEMDRTCDEIIVVDNGSSDSTIMIVNEYPNVKILQLPTITIAAMRNAGVKSAVGDCFAFIDSDCTISPGWRQSALDVFKDDMVGATGSHYEIPDNSNWIVKAWSSNRNKSKTIVKWINTCNLVIRRSVFERIGGFNDKLTTDEDYDIGLRICESGFLMIEDPLIKIVHYKNPDSISKFYRRERWYATSMLSTIGRKRFDRPLVMTLLFMVLLLAFAISIPISCYDLKYLFVSIVLMIGLLAATVLNRAIKYHNIHYFFQLGYLFVIYYSARTVTILEEVIRKIGIISPVSRK
ncbi:MAG TPA: hypothetical protein DEO84_08230 [candidate division Zixibacteria bacterium]|jgi:glycosyltransferase involved in cell wall biosynthesis|nr:hypothetical protein [candidate division Zixibacteria bacterium]HBZ01288.1 hypothetical protein [candidate division Zixibacteria bacterium]